MRKRPSSIFVPYETLGSGVVVRVSDLPRFVESNEVMKFLRSRYGQSVAHRKLDWREETDWDSINEYMLGLGEGKQEPNPLPSILVPWKH